MSDGIISDQILKWIRKNSGNDTAIENFLTELICEEAEHPGQWWWKEVYKQKIDKFSVKWEESHED
jgi:hypothetical protein